MNAENGSSLRANMRKTLRMPNSAAVTFSQSYDLEGRLESFLAQRSSALASAAGEGYPPLRVELLGIPAQDRRLGPLRAAATALRLRIEIVPTPATST